MDPFPWIALGDFAQKGGVIAFLLLILIAGARQVWVWGWMYREAIAKAEKLQEVLDASLRNQERALDIAERRLLTEARPPPSKRGPA